MENCRGLAVRTAGAAGSVAPTRDLYSDIKKSIIMEKIIFTARLHNTGQRIQSISGRLGPFIFRTHQNGLITAFYKPKNGSNTYQSRINYVSLSYQLREITDIFALQITSIESNLPTS